MLPETDFCRRRNLMFLVFDGRYYTAGNSCHTDRDYLEFCGLRFPLSQGRLVADEERGYLKKNSGKIQELKSKAEKEINSGKGIEELTRQLEVLEEINFFLVKICKEDNSGFEFRGYRVNAESAADSLLDTSPIFSGLIDGNCAVVNGRVFPLKPAENVLLFRF